MSFNSEEFLAFHKKHGNKLITASKVSIETMEDLSFVYTPGVSVPSREIARDRMLARDLSIKKNSVAVVSDGSAVLGLGNIGPYGAIPVMEGKSLLFKRFAGIDAFPICLATQDVDEIVKTVKIIAPVFGGINLEDISSPRNFEVLARLKQELDIPVIHDDVQGTAVVVLAALINALKVRGSSLVDVKVVINGAGAAGFGIVNMLTKYGFKNIIVLDRLGALHDGRDDLNFVKQKIVALTNGEKIDGNLSDIIYGADVFIGVSSAGVLTADMVKKMSARPIVFAMANPAPEIMPDEALSAGAFIVATGRSDFPNQVNNVLAFPGIFRGALDSGVTDINDLMLISAAEKLAGCTKDLSEKKILPNAFEGGIVEAVASAIHL